MTYDGGKILYEVCDKTMSFTTKCHCGKYVNSANIEIKELTSSPTPLNYYGIYVRYNDHIYNLSILVQPR